MLDKEVQDILDLFRKNTIDVKEMSFEENPYHNAGHLNARPILPGNDSEEIVKEP